MTCPSRYTIQQDTREKTPLIFPSHTLLLCPKYLPTDRITTSVRIHIEETTLPTGDYRLKDAPTSVIIERKKHLSEVARNCLTKLGRRRFAAECVRLRCECNRPYFLLEGSVASLLRDYIPIKDESPWLAYDALERLALEYGVSMLYLPSSSTTQRRVVGEQMAHLLINGAIAPWQPDLSRSLESVTTASPASN